nr:hypothetical protein [Tanacetum cinerariifolium]
MISPAFLEANYVILESLLMERWKQIRNKDLRTELKYFSKDYDEEKEMEPRPVRIKKTTSVIRTRRTSRLGADIDRSQGINLPLLLVAHLGKSKNGQSLQSSLTSIYGGLQPSINTGGNLSLNDTHLSHNAQLFAPRKSLNCPSHAQNGYPSFGRAFV